jgi:Domain of unknown function (DUF4158)
VAHYQIEAVMPRRTLLSSEQRVRLFSIPIDAAEMTRYFVLSAEDLTLIRTKRRAVNRLGFAIQLCTLRHPGRVLDPAELPPEPMLAFVGKQVGIDPALFGDYARRAETRREHMIELPAIIQVDPVIMYLRRTSAGSRTFRTVLLTEMISLLEASGPFRGLGARSEAAPRLCGG